MKKILSIFLLLNLIACKSNSDESLYKNKYINRSQVASTDSNLVKTLVKHIHKGEVWSFKDNRSGETNAIALVCSIIPYAKDTIINLRLDNIKLCDRDFAYFAVYKKGFEKSVIDRLDSNIQIPESFYQHYNIILKSMQEDGRKEQTTSQGSIEEVLNFIDKVHCQ